MTWFRDSSREAAAKTYSSTGSALVSAVSSAVSPLVVSELPPQAVRARASERVRSREDSFFMGIFLS